MFCRLLRPARRSRGARSSRRGARLLSLNVEAPSLDEIYARYFQEVGTWREELEITRRASRREGSPWTGLWAVVAKEMADHLTSVRMRILEGLIVLTAAGHRLRAMQNLRQTRGPRSVSCC
jgi:hypothetical protein